MENDWEGAPINLDIDIDFFIEQFSVFLRINFLHRFTEISFVQIYLNLLLLEFWLFSTEIINGTPWKFHGDCTAGLDVSSIINKLSTIKQ